MIFQTEPGRIYLMQEGQLLAELTYTDEGSHYNVDHTFVDDSLRGQGVAGRLMETYQRLLEQEQQKSTATCSYAQSWSSKHKEYAAYWLK